MQSIQHGRTSARVVQTWFHFRRKLREDGAAASRLSRLKRADHWPPYAGGHTDGRRQRRRGLCARAATGDAAVAAEAPALAATGAIIAGVCAVAAALWLAAAAAAGAPALCAGCACSRACCAAGSGRVVLVYDHARCRGPDRCDHEGRRGQRGSAGGGRVGR